MQEVRGLNPRLAGLGVSLFQASGGMSTLQLGASGLQDQKDSSEPNKIVRGKPKIATLSYSNVGYHQTMVNNI
jgi:hypothetical protein